ncbi:MAG TPA: hypothetical protein VHZ02_15020, partial [Acidimicrobiales bacterium]|nr:hypothetical protein [Acidimicrobiales bacterium]
AAELAHQHRELSWLVEDSAGPLQVLSLSSMNALDVGTLAARAGTLDAATLGLAQVVHEAAGIRAIVLTYEPKLYQGESWICAPSRPFELPKPGDVQGGALSLATGLLSQAQESANAYP